MLMIFFRFGLYIHVLLHRVIAYNSKANVFIIIRLKYFHDSLNTAVTLAPVAGVFSAKCAQFYGRKLNDGYFSFRTYYSSLRQTSFEIKLKLLLKHRNTL